MENLKTSASLTKSRSTIKHDDVKEITNAKTDNAMVLSITLNPYSERKHNWNLRCPLELGYLVN